MPTQQQVQDTILSAELVAANLTEANRVQFTVGNEDVDWDKVRKLSRNIYALSMLYSVGNYTSAQTLVLYDCLNDMIGFDTNVNTIDPYYQIPGTTIIIQNPAGYLSPRDIAWSQFSTDNSPDFGVSRNTFYEPLWAGINPFMQDETTTLLRIGEDYTLIPTGGFILSASGNLPFIFSGQSLRVYNYALA